MRRGPGRDLAFRRLAAHAGELDLGPGGVDGPMLAVISSALAAGSPGEVMVTGMVKDLALGADLDLAPASDVRLASGDRLALLRAAATPTRPRT